MDVADLRHFVVVADELHFGRAARSLGISRLTLSASVRALEAERGIELFDRSADSTRLTEAGRLLRSEADAIVATETMQLAETAALAASRGLSVAFVPGVSLGRWADSWQRRHPAIPLSVRPCGEEESVSVLRDGIADLSFVRLPVIERGLSVVRLYTENAVVVLGADHPLSLLDELTTADLVDEKVVENPPVAADAVELVAAGVGVLLLPQSLARLHARKDVVTRPLIDGPPTHIAIAWLEDETTPQIEEFVGIVRGRRESSSRSAFAAETPVTPASPAPQARATGRGAAQRPRAGGRPGKRRGSR